MKEISKKYINNCFEPNENSKFLEIDFDEASEYFIYRDSDEKLSSKYHLNGKTTQSNVNIKFKSNKKTNNKLFSKLGLNYPGKEYPKLFELLNDENFAILFSIKFNIPIEILIVSDFLRMEFFINELLELPSVKGLKINNLKKNKKKLKKDRYYKNSKKNVFGNSNKINELYAHGTIIKNQYIKLPKDFKVQLSGIPGFNTKIYTNSPAVSCATFNYNEYIFNIKYSFKSSDFSKNNDYRHFFKNGTINKLINYGNYNDFYKKFTFNFFYWTNSLRKKFTLCDLIRFIKKNDPTTKKLQVNSCLGSDELSNYKSRFSYHNGSMCYERKKNMHLIVKLQNGTYQRFKPKKRKIRSAKNNCNIKRTNVNESEYNKANEFCLIDNKLCTVVPVESPILENDIPRVGWENNCFNNSSPILYNYKKNKSELFDF